MLRLVILARLGEQACLSSSVMRLYKMPDMAMCYLSVDELTGFLSCYCRLAEMFGIASPP